MTYPEAIEFLYGLQMFGAKFGLENAQRLAALAGNPQEQLRFIHVAGTNGKGSTCAMLESIYRASGLRVGLFTSPHLVTFSERIQVNRVPISEVEVARRVEAMQPLLATFPPDTHPTFFEVVMMMALQHFAEQCCDLVILETGLGGRLDATNIVQPLASVITNVQFDHERWLGRTLAAIATEKAGIIKPGVPVIAGPLDAEALAVVRGMAQTQASMFTEVSPADTEQPPLCDIQLPLPGRHQRMNAAVAWTTVRVLANVLPVNATAVSEGLGQVMWAGRLQIVNLPNGRRLLLDGAHNPAGAAALREALAELFPAVQPALILGVRGDKEWQRIAGILGPAMHRVLCVPLNSEATLNPAQLAAACQQANPDAKVEVYATFRDALAAVADEPLVVVSGSLYLIGEAMEVLHVGTRPARDEKSLNEWLKPG